VNELAEKVFHKPPIDTEALIREFLTFSSTLSPFIADTFQLLMRASKDGKSILFEGAQGTMLDIDHGTYPFVTSSSTTIGGVCTGTGVPPKMIHSALGIAKAYCTRVGEGPFPTEDSGSDGDRIRDAGGEYGSTTGRPRRCGWFDVVAVKYAADINGLDALVLTKIDVLDGFDEVKVCVGYELDGKRINHVPAIRGDYSRCKPLYETHPGWKTHTAGVVAWEDLPAGARSYVEYLSGLLGIPVVIISTGKERDQTVIRRELLEDIIN
jgi:adenylosuccinate synthase